MTMPLLLLLLLFFAVDNNESHDRWYRIDCWLVSGDVVDADEAGGAGVGCNPEEEGGVMWNTFESQAKARSLLKEEEEEDSRR